LHFTTKTVIFDFVYNMLHFIVIYSTDVTAWYYMYSYESKTKIRLSLSESEETLLPRRSCSLEPLEDIIAELVIS
jgi:hypothetical protein